MDRDIEFLYEIGCMRNTMRTWIKFMHLVPANVAEHTIRVIWLSIIIAKYEGSDIDIKKIVLMALLHDVWEVRGVDVNYISRMYVDRKEKECIQHTLSGTILEGEYLELREEMDKKETIESKIVKDADNLDVTLELKEMKMNGSTIAEKFIKDRLPVIPDKLFTQSAKKLYQEILSSEPSDRHRKGVNRFTSGDRQKD